MTGGVCLPVADAGRFGVETAPQTGFKPHQIGREAARSGGRPRSQLSPKPVSRSLLVRR